MQFHRPSAAVVGDGLTRKKWRQRWVADGGKRAIKVAKEGGTHTERIQNLLLDIRGDGLLRGAANQRGPRDNGLFNDEGEQSNVDLGVPEAAIGSRCSTVLEALDESDSGCRQNWTLCRDA